MRDLETIETAITAAETGHLVLSTLHTLDATETINRIISVFPPHQQKQIRAPARRDPQGRHLPAPGARADGKGRVPAVEVMIVDRPHPGVHPSKDKTQQIRDGIAARHAQYGMQTFDQSLMASTSEELDHLRRGAAPRPTPTTSR